MRTDRFIMQNQNGEAASEPPTQSGKKPYEKPAFQHEHVFERMALSCGKIDPSEEQCNLQASCS
jgi:hypothetical protein